MHDDGLKTAICSGHDFGGKAVTFVTESQQAEFLELKRKARVPFRQERLALYS